MKSTGRVSHYSTEEELLDESMEKEIRSQRRYLSALDYRLINSELDGSRRKEILKSMINYLVEQL